MLGSMSSGIDSYTANSTIVDFAALARVVAPGNVPAG
jgi:hypothetical protein